ncbi:NAD(P)-dependent oxidoreductase [Edaphobacter modestus]|uniref:3-hydroxyisobutyrate dehydrogenase/2-hydroxy-3-oxopropionate reductase n=1 Tax=Edaphobacter modestus TaxID=388466 RepID=A0A4Q7YZ17_9BACT|nr:NAD(P)-dependent oxidoreductase [Edaphobacter modestus]RZU42521.1 3-hydroxyisobutyrate dehydrogenase/2-hydroxy-3-oxopropionate reductase [Edaphobacter modestus]
MADVGFLGLGIMGAPMAAHLVAAGHNVTVWSHNLEKAARFAREHGCTLAQTPAEVARRSHTSFLCVGDTAMSREVILGEQGLIHGAARGSLIADCSTISPLASKEIGAQLAAKGIRFLDAPCTGSKPGAEAGTLSFMIGGDRAAFDETRPLFETMGKALYYCGEQGMGLHAKVTQNLVLGNILQAFNEGLVLSTKGGVDPRVMIEILNNTGARSGYVASKADSVLKGDFSTTFSVRWMEKDLGLAVEVASELGVPLFTTSASQQQLRTAIAMGFGEDDISGSIRVLEDIASCQVRSTQDTTPV